MSEAVTTPEAKWVAVASKAYGTEGIGKEDLSIPRIQLLQKMSKKCDEEGYKPGDIVENLEWAILGDDKKSVEIIPLSVGKVWYTFEVVNNEPQFTGVVPYGPDNANWRYEETLESGTVVKRSLCMNWHVLLASQVKDKEPMAHVVGFQKTNLKTGKKLATLLVKQKMLNKPAYAKAFSLGAVKVSNDKGTFYNFDITGSRVATKEEQAAGHEWYTILKASNAKTLKEEAVVEEEVPF